MGYGFGQLNEYAVTANNYARRQGFWDNLVGVHLPREPGLVTAPNLAIVTLSKLMLIVTEVAEAAEAVRYSDFDNFAEELADICIRVFDLAEASGVNLEQSIVNKMIKNEQRPPMHGGKTA